VPAPFVARPPGEPGYSVAESTLASSPAPTQTVFRLQNSVLSHRAFSDTDTAEMIRSGQIVDASSLAALTLYRLQSV
jgi:hypothetical protein